MKQTYYELEKLGRVRLSQHYYMRQFLYSEIGAAFGLINLPDFPELAIEAGTMLCAEILEPLTEALGPLIIRSGFRSAKLNAFGASRRLKCAANDKNYAYHIWDHSDRDGYRGAAACVIAPGFTDGKLCADGWPVLARRVHETLGRYHRLTLFTHDGAFNIGWHERPRREIYSMLPSPHWILRV